MAILQVSKTQVNQLAKVVKHHPNKKRQQLVVAALIARSKVYSLIGKQRDAMRDIDISMIISKKLGDNKLYPDCLLELSNINGFLSRYTIMKKVAIKALFMYKEVNDQKGIADSLNNIGGMYERKNDYKKALVYYQRSLEIRTRIKDYIGRGISLNNLGSIHNSIGNYDGALKYYHRALRLQQKIGDRKGQGISFNNIGGIYDCRGDYGRALQYYLKSLKMREEIGHREGQGISLNNTGFVYYRLGNYNKALEYYLASLRMQREIGDRYAEGAGLNNIGKLYQRLSDSRKALEYFQKSLKIREDIGYRFGEAICLNNIGAVLLERNDFIQARPYFIKAKKIAKALGDKELLRRIYVSITELGILLVKVGKSSNLRKAKQDAGLALKYARELKSKPGTAEALLLQARIEGTGARARQENILPPEKKYLQAIDIFKSTGENYELAVVCYYFADFLISLAELQEAKQYLELAKKIFKDVGAKNWLAKAERLSAKSGLH